jgi:hypothetical protein
VPAQRSAQDCSKAPYGFAGGLGFAGVVGLGGAVVADAEGVAVAGGFVAVAGTDVSVGGVVGRGTGVSVGGVVGVPGPGVAGMVVAVAVPGVLVPGVRVPGVPVPGVPVPGVLVPGVPGVPVPGVPIVSVPVIVSVGVRVGGIGVAVRGSIRSWVGVAGRVGVGSRSTRIGASSVAVGSMVGTGVLVGSGDGVLGPTVMLGSGVTVLVRVGKTVLVRVGAVAVRDARIRSAAKRLVNPRQYIVLRPRKATSRIDLRRVGRSQTSRSHWGRWRINQHFCGAALDGRPSMGCNIAESRIGVKVSE